MPVNSTTSSGSAPDVFEEQAAAKSIVAISAVDSFPFNDSSPLGAAGPSGLPPGMPGSTEVSRPADHVGGGLYQAPRRSAITIAAMIIDSDRL